MTQKELKGKRAALVREMRALLDLADSEKRELTAEEQAKYDRLETDVDKMGQEYEASESRSRLAALEAEMDEPETERVETEAKPEQRAGTSRETAFRRYLALGERLPESERRALAMDVDESGGYVVAPQMWMAQIIKAVDDMTFMRGLATTYTVASAASMGVPSLDADPADPTWTSEILVGAEDSTMDFGKRELYPHPLAQYIKVSKKLIRAAGLDVEGLVRSRLAYKRAVTEENAFLNGNGVNQPLGVFTASDLGISTSYDVSTGNTDTAIQADGLIEAKYHLKGQYWPRCRWNFHRDAVKQIRKLKDGEGQYLWRPGIAGDRGDTILDVPVVMSEYAPNTFTTGLYVGIIGDFSFYWIADALGATIQVLTELYAATNQNGYILRSESDGMPVLGEAFIRVTLA